VCDQFNGLTKENFFLVAIVVAINQCNNGKNKLIVTIFDYKGMELVI
jgi:hypothetical protein